MIKQNFYYLKPKKERLDYLLTNYRDMDQIIHTKKQSLAVLVSNEIAYAKKKSKGEIGVPISKTNNIVSPTEAEAIEHVLVMKSIEEGKLSEELDKNLPDSKRINREIFDINLLYNEYHLLNCHMESMPLESKKDFIPYINRKVSIYKLADKYVIEPESVKQRLYRIRKQLKETVLAYMDDYSDTSNLKEECYEKE